MQAATVTVINLLIPPSLYYPPKAEWLKKLCVSIQVLRGFKSVQWYILNYLQSSYHFVACSVTLPCPFWCRAMGRVLPAVTLPDCHLKILLTFSQTHTHTSNLPLPHSCLFLFVFQGV